MKGLRASRPLLCLSEPPFFLLHHCLDVVEKRLAHEKYFEMWSANTAGLVRFGSPAYFIIECKLGLLFLLTDPNSLLRVETRENFSYLYYGIEDSHNLGVIDSLLK